jgi:hypothetical protein
MATEYRTSTTTASTCVTHYTLLRKGGPLQGALLAASAKAPTFSKFYFALSALISRFHETQK